MSVATTVVAVSSRSKHPGSRDWFLAKKKKTTPVSKLRKRVTDGEFYPVQRIAFNNRRMRIPASYYDQIQGNMAMMGLGLCYFVVLSPTGYHVQIEPYDEAYCHSSLFPCLDRFCRAVVLWGKKEGG